ncbi:M23 family metallopeptidase [bacterium]|nr:M23 family metallopeptidase [bacterium]
MNKFTLISTFLILTMLFIRTQAHAEKAINDDKIYKLIDSLRGQSSQIKVDGSSTDWKGIPAFKASREAFVNDGSRDIVNISIAPREDELLILIKTRGRPSQDPLTFYTRLDFIGQHESDCQIGFGQDGVHRLKVYDERNNSETILETVIRGPEIVVGDAVEIRIPFQSLKELLPEKMAKQIDGPRGRPWIRVYTFAWNPKTQKIADYGPAVASFRLIKTPYPLDPPAPHKIRPEFGIRVPFKNKWFLGNGAFGLRAHVNVHGYDFYIMDDHLNPAQNRGSKNNEDYYTWGLQFLSPVDGEITKVTNNMPDRKPLNKVEAAGNNVWIALDSDPDLSINLNHFQMGTIKVQTGDSIRAGEEIGLVGNSGQSGWPHIHMGLVQKDLSTLPISFSNVIVSLNPQADDPWSRDLSIWELRAGVFIQNKN